MAKNRVVRGLDSDAQESSDRAINGPDPIGILQSVMTSRGNWARHYGNCDGGQVRLDEDR